MSIYDVALSKNPLENTPQSFPTQLDRSDYAVHFSRARSRRGDCAELGEGRVRSLVEAGTEMAGGVKGQQRQTCAGGSEGMGKRERRRLGAQYPACSRAKRTPTGIM